LFVYGAGVVLDGGEALAGGEVPVLDLPLCVGGGEDVAGFEVVVFGAPEDVGEGGFGLVGDGGEGGLLFVLYVEYLHGSVLAGCCEVFVLGVEFDGIDLYFGFAAGEEVGDLDV
jgi:hypothetical protein